MVTIRIYEDKKEDIFNIYDRTISKFKTIKHPEMVIINPKHTTMSFNIKYSYLRYEKFNSLKIDLNKIKFLLHFDDLIFNYKYYYDIHKNKIRLYPDHNIVIKIQFNDFKLYTLLKRKQLIKLTTSYAHCCISSPWYNNELYQILRKHM